MRGLGQMRGISTPAMKRRGEGLLVIGTLLLLSGIVAFSAYGRWRIGMAVCGLGIALLIAGRPKRE